MPPLLMPVAYTRAASTGTCRSIAATIAVMNPVSSAFVRPGVPQQPPPVFQARLSPSG